MMFISRSAAISRSRVSDTWDLLSGVHISALVGQEVKSL